MNPFSLPELPVSHVFPEIKKQLHFKNRLILQAPPGAGKTTLVPLALLDQPWLKDQKILILEPRRLAARAAAARMAQLLGEKVGERVGYRIRMEKRCGPQTRIEVITEGMLTRFLQRDPSLEGIGVIIFDEFHERSLHGDLGLAFALEVQETLREDLRLIVMSATLDSTSLLTILPEAPVVTSEGRSFPVETKFVEPVEPLEQEVLRVVEWALKESDGGILVFLPGAGEIRRVHSLLKEKLSGAKELLIAPLYSSLPIQEQNLAVFPSKERKIVLATSIAETSLTIEDIRVVVDSGLMRIPRFDPRTAMDRLETVTVTRDSADQRRGRAGRLGPGICYRLWSRFKDSTLVSFRSPEILQTDLTSFALELALWGKESPSELSFIDPPPENLFNSSRELLVELDALDGEGHVTEKGRRMAELSLHPRLAHGVLEAERGGFTACLLASLLSEGDIIKGENPDILLRLEILGRLMGGEKLYRNDYSTAQSRRVIASAETLAKQTGSRERYIELSLTGAILAGFYPDRIGKRTAPGQYQLVNGKQAFLKEEFFPGSPEFIVAAHLGGRGPAIFLAAPYSFDLLKEQFSHHFLEEIVTRYNPEKNRVSARKYLRLGRLLLKESPVSLSDRRLITAAVIEYIREKGLSVLPWDKKSLGLWHRIQAVCALGRDGWPPLNDGFLLEHLEEWLAPWVGEGSLDFSLTGALESLLSWDQKQLLDRLAPSHLDVPSGSKIPIDYSDPEVPVVAVRLQEVFGITEHPVAGGKKILLHLLSPAHRPVQITRDLPGFWSNSYKDVKKDLMGRYPKHFWPEDPANAPATNRTKKRM